MTRYLTKTFLGAAGGLLIAIGVGVLFQPQEFSAANGVILSDDASHLSEVRAPGGLLLISGLIILFGVWRDQLMRTGLALAALVYGTYGIARLFSLFVDGAPSQSLVQAMIVELVVTAIALTLLWRPLGARSQQTRGG